MSNFRLPLIGMFLAFAIHTASPAAILPGGVYVVSNPTSGPAQILRYSNDPSPIYKGVFATLPTGSFGTGMSVGPDGKLWVADYGNGTVSTVDGAGTVTTQLTGLSNAIDATWYHQATGANAGDYLFYTTASGSPNHAVYRRTWTGTGSGLNSALLLGNQFDYWGVAGWNGAGDGRIYSLAAIPAQSYGNLWDAPFGNPNNSGTWGAFAGQGRLDIIYNPYNGLYYETRDSELTGGVDQITVNQFSGAAWFGPVTGAPLNKPHMLEITPDNVNLLITQSSAGGNNVIKMNIGSGTLSSYIAAGNGLNNPYGIVYVIPEPAAAALIGVGGLLMLGRRRKQNG